MAVLLKYSRKAACASLFALISSRKFTKEKNGFHICCCCFSFTFTNSQFHDAECDAFVHFFSFFFFYDYYLLFYLYFFVDI